MIVVGEVLYLANFYKREVNSHLQVGCLIAVGEVLYLANF
ncbi:hypothetical protein P20495_4196 [Pseudoalteromonas sp. BSi20495]|nr:hypothetical protein P20495_4196 [Pseudoalteromonas sp. BSi20495]